MNRLLEPIEVGNLKLKNRIIFPPLTTGYEEKDGSISERAIRFYERLASGGTSYIVLGDVSPVMTLSPTPKLHEDSMIPSFRKLTEAVHKQGAYIAAQIFHPEYNPIEVMEMFKKGDMGGLRKKMHHDMENYCNEISIDRIKEIQNAMIETAVRAEKAGFDAVQIHGDRLIGMFSSPIMNKRNDEYGGSLSNRLRFALEVLEGIKRECPNIVIEYKLAMIRMNPRMGKGGPSIDEGPEIAKWLEKKGVHMIHVCQANHTAIADTLPPMGIQPHQCFTEMAGVIKKYVSIPVSAVGKIVNPKQAAGILKTNKADIIALGRPLLADPDWVNKISGNKEHLIRHCILCNKGCTDRITSRSSIGCILNAENGYESQRVIRKAVKKKRVAVVGAGVAGLEAARVAAMRGHSVTIFEKSSKIGGQINIAAVPPRKDEMLRILHYYEEILKKEKVNLIMNEDINADVLVKLGFEHVIVAVGAHNISIPIEGIDSEHVLNAWEVLEGRAICGGKVAVIGGGMVGAETAEFLAERKGCSVSIIEMTDRIAKEESMSIRPTLLENYERLGVEQYVNHKLISIKEEEIVCEDLRCNRTNIPADYVVMAVGAKSNSFDTSVLSSSNIAFDLVGDCNEEAADIEVAIKTAYDAANRI